ncbi:unnamed protein product, partial [marine sediment metagenome]
MSKQMKECQKCHQVFPRDSFYKRKDRNGEYTWRISYCRVCNLHQTKGKSSKNLEHYREYSNKYYHNNIDK